MNKYIFYFHGGGLVSGTPNDLPQTHQDSLKQLGYTIVTVPYPLAPEASFEAILQSAIRFIDKYETKEFFFFGRSAGAFLAFHVAQFHPPKGIISFYGYMLNDTEWVDSPSQHYNQYPPITIDFNHLKERFALYIHLRQTGTWRTFIQYHHQCHPNPNIPVFIWHSLFDPDVPYHEARAIQSYFKDTTLHTALLHEHEIDIKHWDQIKTELIRFIKKVEDGNDT